MKDFKIFLEKKKTKGKKGSRQTPKCFSRRKKNRCNKNLSEEQKKKLAEYRRNYYLAHKKTTIKRLFRFLKDPGTIK